ncbi:uncharacterized protein LOC121839260 isoform X1 [Oncorhynchus tshawytscha]|uniref:uncharacterized protein LOC121839260 isoform X1 n=1 Tax=Oncorhynchus tshawytscha TaxID=74940 RepID=UPI001C3D4BE8|nr:uncharacterized protein LOC121839260 isoform X1 [Oncorhynchus tshawytscha]
MLYYVSLVRTVIYLSPIPQPIRVAQLLFSVRVYLTSNESSLWVSFLSRHSIGRGCLHRSPDSAGGGLCMLCCRGKTYDPSSGQMKSVAGTLYDLQVQDRLSEDAQCCGNLLMEAGSTCCSDPGLDLLYPTQPGFTCCGHRYPNSSLWSCCAGVLHPRLEPHTTSMNMTPGPRILPLGSLKTEVLCDTRVLLGTVESVSVKRNERSIMMGKVMSMQALCGPVNALPAPHYLTYCSSTELVPGNTDIWVETRHFSETVNFISDLSDYSSLLSSTLSRCSKLYFNHIF